MLDLKKTSSREVHMRALTQLQASSALRAKPDVVYGAMIPEPDYSDEESELSKSFRTNLVARNNKNNVSSKEKENDRFDQNGLILPKKIPNPCIESSDKKNLHKELLFNQKLGINVLNQKSELQKAMEKHKDKKALKEQEKEKKSNLTPFQKAMDQRAQKLEMKEKETKEETKEKLESSEFQKVHAKLRSKIEAN